MKATLTPESYKQGRNFVKTFNLESSIKEQTYGNNIVAVELNYHLDKDICMVSPVLEDDTEVVLDEMILVLNLNPDDHDVLSDKCDKYVLEEYFGRKHTFKIERELEIEFDEF
jgi:hypothetical protein